MASRYTTFFLNSSSHVVQLELLEISHPNFSKTYRIVRNAIKGVTVKLEDGTMQTFDYYPVKVTPTGNSSDLDQTLQLQFGDLGEIMPQELDRMVAFPGVLPNIGALLGVFTDDAGNILAPPFAVGNGTFQNVPSGATLLSLGINDTIFTDNHGSFAVTLNGDSDLEVDVAATAAPWNYVAGGINNAYPFSSDSPATHPRTISVVGMSSVQIGVTGTIGTSGLSGLPYDGFGDPTQPAAIGDGSAGTNIPLDPMPGTYIKPSVLYRTYRSDDLSSPLLGPQRFQINNIGFKKEGATMQCSAPRLNLSTTGENYTMDRFPMLRGFL